MAKIATYATAINSINPDARIMIDGDITNYDNIQWLEDTTPIAKDVLDAKVIECQKTYKWRTIDRRGGRHYSLVILWQQ